MFDKLKIAEQLGPGTIFYSAHFFDRKRVKASRFHVDFSGTNNGAYNIVFPLQDMSDHEFGHCLYRMKKLDATEHKLVYEYGRGYGFGDNCMHSSEPVDGREKLLFICFRGNTKMTEKQHKKAFSYIASQTARYYDEHGTAVESDENLFDLPEDSARPTRY